MTEDDIERLKARIAHLERELDTSYEAEAFKRTVKSIYPDEDAIEVTESTYGLRAEAVIEVYYLQDCIRRVERRDDIGWQIKEGEDGGPLFVVGTGLEQ